jgi:hypothetical protein
MDDETRKNLQDILNCIHGIEQYIAGNRDFNGFEHNRMMRKSGRAGVRNYVLIAWALWSTGAWHYLVGKFKNR